MGGILFPVLPTNHGKNYLLWIFLIPLTGIGRNVDIYFSPVRGSNSKCSICLLASLMCEGSRLRINLDRVLTVKICIDEAA